MKLVQTDYNLKINDYYTGVSCGGNSLIRNAMLNNADKTGNLMFKKMRKRDLKAPEKGSESILIWACENGLDTSPIVAALNDRI